MGRRSHSRSLSIWANGVRVGRWTIPARGEMELQYAPGWIGADIGRLLSLSLPFNLQNLPLKGRKVANYFDNLLPDSDAIRRRVAEQFRTGSTEPFDLLKAIGRDCVGAVQLLAEDEAPVGFDRIEGVPLSEEAIERHLIEAVSPQAFAAVEIRMPISASRWPARRKRRPFCGGAGNGSHRATPRQRATSSSSRWV